MKLPSPTIRAARTAVRAQTRTPLRTGGRSQGFTLVEVAVALVIIGMGLTLCLEALQAAKMQAAHTRNLKLARELGVLTLGQIESGLFAEELESGYSETYAGENYPDFFFELRVGEDVFEDVQEEYDNSGYHDAFAARREREFESEQDDDEEDVAEEFEKVRIRVSFPQFAQFKNYVTIETWMDWEQVYGSEEEEGEEEADA